MRNSTFFDGTVEEFSGVCHIPMEPSFCNDTRQILYDVAKSLGLRVHPQGTAVTIEGPRFSSKAESLMYQSWGAHLVNMTLFPEVRIYNDYRFVECKNKFLKKNYFY